MKTFEQIVQGIFGTEDDMEYIVHRLNREEISRAVQLYADQCVSEALNSREVTTGDIDLSVNLTQLQIDETKTEGECDCKCTHCGECIDDLSEYYKVEGYCKDCL